MYWAPDLSVLFWRWVQETELFLFWKFKCAPHIWKNIDPCLEEPKASLVWRAGKVVAEDEDNSDQESEDGGASQRPVEFPQNIYEDASFL